MQLYTIGPEGHHTTYYMIPIKKTVRVPASAKHVLPKTTKGGTVAKCKQQQDLPDFHVLAYMPFTSLVRSVSLSKFDDGSKGIIMVLRWHNLCQLLRHLCIHSSLSKNT